MMGLNHQIYQKAGVTTAPLRSILIQLQQKSVSELRLAYAAWQAQDLSGMRGHITRVQDICTFLRGSLDPASEASQPLAETYAQYLLMLSQLFTSPNEESFSQMLALLDSWMEVWRTAPNASTDL